MLGDIFLFYFTVLLQLNSIGVSQIFVFSVICITKSTYMPRLFA